MYEDIYADSGNADIALPYHQRQIHRELSKENIKIFQNLWRTPDSFCPIIFAQVAHHCSEAIIGQF